MVDVWVQNYYTGIIRQSVGKISEFKKIIHITTERGHKSRFHPDGLLSGKNFKSASHMIAR